VKRFFMLLAIPALSLGLALPLIAQEKAGEKSELHKGCEHVTIDRPLNDVIRQVPEALRGAGLILAGEVDWSRLGAGAMPHGKMPGETPRLEAGLNVRTFLIADDYMVNEVRKDPEKALWLGKLAVFEKGGKTEIVYGKPTMHIETLKKAGIIPAEKADEHMKPAQEYERRIEQAVKTVEKK